MKFYFAGKIGRDDWRHSMVLGLREGLKTSGARLYTQVDDEYGSYGPGLAVMPDEWPILRGAVLGQHDYVGPFFMPTQYGKRQVSVHGAGQHGMGIADDSMCIESGTVTQDVYDIVSSNHGAMSNEQTRERIVALCLKSILKADAVFVWMDSPSAYGTLVELGFALAHSKPIWWAQPIKSYDHIISSDFWFIQTAAEMSTEAPDAKTAFEQLLARKFHAQINGYVYVLRSGDFIKIGKSKQVDQRVTQISPKTPMPVTLLHSIACEDMSQVEAALHRRYAHYRTNGEWFLLPQEELSWLLTIKTVNRLALPDRLS